MATLAGQGITRGEIRVFEHGDWFADIATNSGELIPDGQRVEVVAENVTLSGAIVRGGITEAVGRYQVAGRPEWGKPLPARKSAAYRSAGGVQRRMVLSDIAREVLGPQWASLVVMPPEAVLGQHYERRGSLGDVVITGRDALELLGVPWYVRADGVTVFGDRPAGDVTTAETIRVTYENAAIGYRLISCEDPVAFQPGKAHLGEVIGEITYQLTAEDLAIHTWSRAASTSFGDAIRSVWRRLFPRVELQGVFSYSTVGPSQSGRHVLRSTRSRDLPDVDLCDSWGAAGLTSYLAAGTRVLVTFADGDPSSPVLVAVEPGATPVSSAIIATTTLSADAAAVNLGEALAPVVRYGDTVAIAGAGPAAGILSFTPSGPVLLPSRVKA
jgi:hypothetical protein